MQKPTLLDFIADQVAELLRSESEAGSSSAAGMRAEASDGLFLEQAKKIAEDLILEAVRSGLPLVRFDIDREPLGGGNTAEMVEKLMLRAPFVLKLDSKTKKLAEEALAMRAIKSNGELPERYRAAWPTIYAVRREAPFAYLMEMFPRSDGWESLEDMLFAGNPTASLTVADALATAKAVLDLMFAGFDSSVDIRARPNLDTDYVGRIGGRLREAAEVDPRFLARPLVVNGLKLRPWSEYLELLASRADTLRQIAPNFRTVVHGDPNPGNIMLRRNGDIYDIKFIDPKEWITGDYLFDIAKLTHFLEATGPIEKPMPASKVGVSYVEREGVAFLNYQYQSADWTEPIVRACYERVREFAETYGDAEWEARYELAMASNLLGLPLGRLTHVKKPRPESALILYAEGMRWLDRFCARFSPAKWDRSISLPVAQETDIEPDTIKEFRARVAGFIPEVTLDTDRRGFKQFHWTPSRPNDRGKSNELSLEHELRLAPLTERGLEQLLLRLHDSLGRKVSELVLPGSTKFADLTVQRYPREAGPQSVDHYYDVKGIGSRLELIPKMFTLRRRVKVSNFMTWSVIDQAQPAGQQAPLNLEIPFVALGNTGMIARLEFNWIDSLETALGEAADATLPSSIRNNNPLCLVSAILGASFAGAMPVIEHTTFREKFSFTDTSGEKRFALNVDRIMAQALETGRMGNYVDVDISSYRPIDASELAALTAFGSEVVQIYGFGPNLATKAWRDALVVGLLDVG